MIVGAAIAPHGSMILPNEGQKIHMAKQIHQKMLELSTKIQNLNPDIIFLSTPHGIALERNFGFYRNIKAMGSAEWYNEYSSFRVLVDIDTNKTDDLLVDLKAKNHHVEGITSYTQSEPIYLRWGEVVPIWFLRRLNKKYIILSQPSRRLKQTLEMKPELELLGSDIASYFDSIPDKVFVLISGDMAHTYQEEGPYGIHPSAKPFDDAIEKWANTLNKDYLVEAGSLVNTALSCGYTGFVLLDSLLKSLNKEITATVLCNLAPSYYGMMVATFDF